MIIPDELRRGNLLTMIGKVQLPYQSINEALPVSAIVRVEVIGGDFLWVNTKNGIIPGVSVESFEPILLSRETLKKIGFTEEWDEEFPEYLQLRLFSDAECESHIYRTSFLQCDLPKEFENDPLKLQLEVYINSEEYQSSIKYRYLHQLQNLYYALTGKELIIPD